MSLRPVIPFTAWKVPNILRFTIPYQISGPGEEGLESITIFDLLVFPQSWGRFGVGLVGSFSSGTDETEPSAAGGPAIGFVKPMSKKLNLGLFNQNVFASGVGISQLQPILAYQLGDGWSLSLGDLQIVYDWEGGGWVSIPIGVQLGKVMAIAGQPVRFAVNPQYNLKDPPGSDRFSVLLTASLIGPGS